MTVAVDSRNTLTLALAASLGLHALAALIIPAMAWTESTAPEFQTITFVHIAHVEIAPKRKASRAPRAAAPVKSTFSAVHFVTRHELAHTTVTHRARPIQRPVIAQTSVAHVVATVAQAGSADGAGQAPPHPAATPAHVVSSVGDRADGGYLPFGAEQPDPVLDPGIQKQLAALNVHVTLVVTVGDDGRTKNVVFQPPVAPQIEARIQSLLADASWDPAICGGGVACQGQATIKL